MKLNKETEVDKKEYIESFVLEVKDKIEGMSNFNPELLLKALSKIRNPKLQYEFLNVNNDNIDSIKEYIVSLDDSTFKNIVYNYFSYPLDITVEEYHKKWIGKDKIHIKFAKNILKNYSDEDKIDLVSDNNNGIKLNELVEEHVKEVQKPKNKIKAKSLGKKESSLSSFLKKFSKK